MAKREDWEITKRLREINEQEAEAAKNVWNAKAIADIETVLKRSGDDLGVLVEIERILSSKPY